MTAGQMLAAALALAGGAGAALAQEAMYTAAATMPSPGTGIVRPQLHIYRFGENPTTDVESTTIYEAETSIAYGIARDFAGYLVVPLQYEVDELENGDEDDDKGVDDLEAMLKWRFYKDDSGGLDTLRAALIVGAAFASGDDDDFSSGSVNPRVGAVVTSVQGRHGFNQDLSYQWNTGGDAEDNFGGEGPDDAIRAGSAYVYRIAPVAYTADSKGAWYLTAEVNTLYETGGDVDVRFAPGIMYEGWRWAIEVMGQLPIYQDVDERPEFEWGIGVGVRFSF